MTKVIASPYCGNSPKMEFLKKFSIAFAEVNLIFLIKNVTDDIVWSIIGGQKIEGKANFIKALEEVQCVKTAELILDQILSHGKGGAANGTRIMENGEDYAFSDFYIFQSVKGEKINAITSYCIKI
ncbi:nuclear transport factor 2 family protein [Joostella atrarenae]|uniref:Nuclear transport factor 2 family protein n=1 Tax=Joostella atrarenae TaxID=679257 RepID=A0ABS9J7D9_9FLAO|nr:nuclear transport factor 2 family protein [Joostella atrarenae]MCF8716324.1 nuclear transport factor 2 family protein [Joostella atrarenae]